MSTDKKVFFGVISALVILSVVAGAWFLWPRAQTFDLSKTPPLPEGTPTPEILLASVDQSRMQFSKSLTEEEKQARLKTADELRQNLVKNPAHAPTWRQYGSELKFFGDYLGAAGAWSRSFELNPIGDIAVHNLADLYNNFLHDYERAEWYYRKAIQLEPGNSFDYTALADLYRWQLQRPAKDVEAIMLWAMENNPDDKIDFQNYLIEYFTTLEDAEKVKYYQELAS